MPDPADYDNKDDFVSDCVGQMIDEGKDQDEAVAACNDMWDRHVSANKNGCACGGSCNCEGDCSYGDSTQVNTNSATTPHAHPVVNVETDNLRTEQLHGREHRVAPVVAAVADTVMNGALVPMDEWKRSLPSWNGRPIPVNHPEAHGQPVSANTPQVLEKSSIGQFFNATLDENGKFKGELWIDVERANEIAPDVMAALDNGSLEVSTAYFAVDEPTVGTAANGEQYQVVHRFLLPDHLAVLPNQKGACSWEDGCGAPRTHQQGDDMETDENFATRAKRWLGRLFGHQHVEGNQDRGGEDTRELETDLMNALEEQLGASVFVETVFFEQQVVVYEVIGDVDELIRLFQRSYERQDDGSITFGDDVQEVQRVVSFEPVSNASGGTSPAATHSEVSSMADKEQRIGELIDNDKSPFAEEDRETLQAFSDEKVEALAKSYEDDGEPAPAANGDEGQGDGEPAPAAHATTVEEYIGAAPGPIQDTLRTMQREHEAKRSQLIETITANEANAFSKDELAEMDTERLNKLAAFARKPSYEGRGNPGRDADLEANGQDEQYEAPSLMSRVQGAK